MNVIRQILMCLIFPVHIWCESSSSNQHEDLFRRLFKHRRAEQIAAVKNMQLLQESKQFKMVKTVSTTIFDIILRNILLLENSGYTPGLSEFPEKETIRDALSLILENTALMGDIVLRLPEVGQRVLHSDPGWLPLFTRSLTFANQTNLLDNSTSTLFNLVSQELNLTARSTDYINPYRKTNKAKLTTEQEQLQIKKKRKKTEISRGPRLSLQQTGEL